MWEALSQRRPLEGLITEKDRRAERTSFHPLNALLPVYLFLRSAMNQSFDVDTTPFWLALTTSRSARQLLLASRHGQRLIAFQPDLLLEYRRLVSKV